MTATMIDQVADATTKLKAITDLIGSAADLHIVDPDSLAVLLGGITDDLIQVLNTL